MARIKGAVGHAKRRTAQLVARARAGKKLTPLEVFLKAMYRELEKVDPETGKVKPDLEAAAVYARDAAPYIHPKLQAVSQELLADINIGQVDAPVKEDREAWLAKRNAALTVISGAKAS